MVEIRHQPPGTRQMAPGIRQKIPRYQEDVSHIWYITHSVRQHEAKGRSQGQERRNAQPVQKSETETIKFFVKTQGAWVPLPADHSTNVEMGSSPLARILDERHGRHTAITKALSENNIIDLPTIS